MQIKPVKAAQVPQYPKLESRSGMVKLCVGTGATLLSITLLLNLTGCHRKYAGIHAPSPPEKNDERMYGGIMATVKPVYFDFDKVGIRPDQERILKMSLAIIKSKDDKIFLQIEGYCDERGSTEYNLALGERRANEVKKYLIDHGIAAERISIISYGKERPADPAHTEEAWAKNRRAAITAKK